jgi:hypothetical protein
MTTGTSLRGVDEAREFFGLTYEEIASSIRADNATLYRWREGATPSPVYQDRLQCLAELVKSALAQIGREHVGPWLSTPSAVFGGRSPKDMILAGRAETVLGTLLSREFLVHALARQEEGQRRGSMMERATLALWRAEVGAMFDRMQAPAFAAAALRALDEPLRVELPENLRRKQV